LLDDQVGDDEVDDELLLLLDLWEVLVFTAKRESPDKLAAVTSTKAVAPKMANIVNAFVLVYMYRHPCFVEDKCWLTKLTNK
jgi:hypothetical protein